MLGCWAVFLAVRSLSVSAHNVDVEGGALLDELASLKQELRALRLELTPALTGRQLQNEALSSSFLFAEVEDLKAQDKEIQNSLDTIWILCCCFIASLMHAGFAMLETGSCRARNASNLLLKNVMNMCVGTLGWWLFGWAFAFGDLRGGFLGTTGFAGSDFLLFMDHGLSARQSCADDSCVSRLVQCFFQWIFCTTCVTIVSGGVAERAKTGSYMWYSLLMTSIIYPCVVAWTWGGGWLSAFQGVGFTDFAGSMVVHMTGGIGALSGVIVLGPRKGRFEDPKAFEPHSLPLVVLGTLILWFGWLGFNSGSTLSLHSKDSAALAAQVAMNTVVAGAAGGLTVFMLRLVISRRYDVCGLCNGILAGLVSITAGCGNMTCSSAILVSFIGGWVYQVFSMLLLKFQIDDPLDASAVHGACGFWGGLAAVLFDWGIAENHFHGSNGWNCKVLANSDGVCEENLFATALLAQLVCLLVIVAWVLACSMIVFITLSLLGQIRITQKTEETGVDQEQHVQTAYAM